MLKFVHLDTGFNSSIAMIRAKFDGVDCGIFFFEELDLYFGYGLFANLIVFVNKGEGFLEFGSFVSMLLTQ